MSKAGVRAKGGHKGLLQAILRLGRPDAAHQEPVQLGGVGVDQRLERREVHDE